MQKLGYYTFKVFFLGSFFLGCFFPAHSQVLVQDFNDLHDLNQFQGNPPNDEQVEKINFSLSNDQTPIFSLETEGQNQYLRMDKRGYQYRHFDRRSGINDEPFLRISFDFSVISKNIAGKFAAFFIGDTLNENSFYPDKEERWVQIGILVDTAGGFALTHENLLPDGTVFVEARTVYFSGEQRVSIITSNGEEGDPITYSGPDGEEVELEKGKVHIWVGNNYLLEGPALRGESSSINAVKFLLWGNDNMASARMDNLIIARDIEIDPLPVNLINFSVKEIQAGAQLEWQTSSEINSSHFEIEGSLDGENFTALGTVAAAGNSRSTLLYTFEDRVLAGQQASAVYYRLKQIDLDGTAVYSSAISLNLEEGMAGKKNVFPNPFHNQLNVRVFSRARGGLTIRLLTPQGKLVLEDQQAFSSPEVEQLYTIRPGNILRGLYILEIWNGNRVQRYKVVKL